MKRKCFSILEFVFVVIILGGLASLALSWISSTRNDSQVAIARSDLSNVLKTIPSFVFAGNMEVASGNPPNGYKSWGEYLLDISSLDKKRWKATNNGLQVLSNTLDSSKSPQVCSGNYLYIDTKEGKLYFVPNNIDKRITFCKLFAESYKNNNNVTINLITNSTLSI
ncbi:hypothetical protein [Helicobacter sp. MIT 14-3879]|uniref:hypothetical protein n=1 Tax=Helicobacter sp. MIT 14-3879 TaxID=2040649 RepID=UPI000E1E9259|nr:hypothetical protein [Helicobacter sp. MIT 14-3879]RDU64091.1 hypothetical protein CQA44_03965 [Helicobacter sp. MIT 14-3879]